MDLLKVIGIFFVNAIAITFLAMGIFALFGCVVNWAQL